MNSVDPEASESVVLYRHDLFQKGQYELLKSMSTKRKKKGKKGKDGKTGKGEDAIKDASEDTDGEREVDIDDDVNIQEEKAYNQDSPHARLPQHLRAHHEGEAKADGASDFVRQHMQQQLSFTSSLAASRITTRQPGVSDAVGLLGAGATAGGMQLGQNPALPDSRRLLETLISQGSEQHQQQRRMELALLRQQQDNLASEILAQRRLAASAAAPGALPLRSSLTMEGRLSTLQDPTLQGIHRLTSGTGTTAANPTIPSRSHSMNDLPAVDLQRNLSDIAARMQMQRPQSQTSDLAASLNLQSQNLAELRAALEARSQTDIAAALHLVSEQSQRRPANDSLSALQLLSRGGGGQALHHSRSVPEIPALLQMQIQLEQQQERQRAANALAGAATGNAAALAAASSQGGAEQQLLEALMERQRLEAQLLEEQQRRQQGR